MRITESHLRRIVRQEILKESEYDDDIMRNIPGRPWTDTFKRRESDDWRDPYSPVWKQKVFFKHGDAVRINLNVNMPKGAPGRIHSDKYKNANGMEGVVVPGPGGREEYRHYYVKLEDGTQMLLHDSDIEHV